MRRLAGIAGRRWEASLTAEPALFNAFCPVEGLEAPMKRPSRPGARGRLPHALPLKRQRHPGPTQEAISRPELGQIGALPGRDGGLL